MAIRNTRLITKNTLFPSQTLPSSGVLQGEALVNLGDGILFFSGGTSGSPTFVPSNNTTPGYFEVGSNLYQLKIRDKITSYSGVTDLTGKILSGTSQGFVLVDAANINGVSAFTYNELTNTLTIIDTSGDQYPATITSFSGLSINGNFNVTGNTNLVNVTATTISSTTIYADNIITNGDVTLNNLTVTGNTSLQSTSATTFSANSVNIGALGSNRVVYTTGSGQLTTESNFTYDEGTDTMGVNNIDASGDVTIQGSLTVFGPSVSAFTSNLYVEDPNITLNYNPTGSTTTTSVNSGFVVQDGNGITGGSVNWDIVRMQNLTGLTVSQIPSVSEYTGPTGFVNRGWITQLNDIVIRSTDPIDDNALGSINGVRVLAEFDVLDGGTY
jgi:hypothetical protein